jgi:hypothetical protein
MITEDTLREAMREHARSAPDPAEVRAGIAQRLRSPGLARHRQVAMAAAAACAAAAVAVPVALLRPEGPGGAGPVTGGAAATPSTSAPATRIALQPLAVPFSVPVLPAGWIGPGDVSTRPGYAERRFTGPDPNSWLTVRLWDPSITDRPGTAPMLGSRQFPVSRKVGGSLWLGVDGSVGRAVLDRVARSVEVDRTERLTFPFRLTHLPPGVRPVAAERFVTRVGIDGDAEGRTPRVVDYDPLLLSGMLALDDRPDTPIQNAWLSIEVHVSDQVGGPKYHEPNTTVLGSPARYDADDHGTALLQVFNLRGLHVIVQVNPAGHGGVDRAEMVRIVEGMRLVPDPTKLSDWTVPLS